VHERWGMHCLSCILHLHTIGYSAYNRACNAPWISVAIQYLLFSFISSCMSTTGKKRMKGLLDDRRKQITDETLAKVGIRIIQRETDMDHIQIPFTSRPPIGPSPFVNTLKSVVSGRLGQEFPSLTRKHLRGGVFWSPSYFLISTRNVPERSQRSP
jgi:REP element-mobilizing transposase RayT